MQSIYNALAVPFGYVMHFFYSFSENYILSLFLLVLIVRLILLPSAMSQQKNSAKQIRLQPKINRIRQRYSNGGSPTREQQMKIQEETQALYQKEGYSATSGGCLSLLIQFPVMMGLYGVVYTPISKVLRIASDTVAAAAEALGIATTSSSGLQRYEIEMLSAITSDNMPSVFSEYADEILKLKDQFMLFGKIDLTQTPSWREPGLIWIIPLLAFAFSMLSSILMYKKQRQTNPEMAKNPSMGCMTFMSPFMSLIFTFMFPAGVGVYWILSSMCTFIQTLVLNYSHSPQKVIANAMIDETVERRSREASIKKLKEFSDKNSDN
ncbi:MAG: YidC/Oxa1 family membrane protein insertase [Clostridiales bacterium]|nr:YidC/Oxa1 family membrane protein insertase [Clostridiales bacterium]